MTNMILYCSSSITAPDQVLSAVYGSASGSTWLKQRGLARIRSSERRQIGAVRHLAEQRGQALGGLALFVSALEAKRGEEIGAAQQLGERLSASSATS